MLFPLQVLASIKLDHKGACSMLNVIDMSFNDLCFLFSSTCSEGGEQWDSVSVNKLYKIAEAS